MLTGSIRTGLVLTLTLATIAGATGAEAAASRGPGHGAVSRESATPPAPTSPEARRRWALARMNEAAAERRRCPERFRAPADVRACEARFARQYQNFNEIYIEASR
jgi:hypothetical protein